MSTEELTARVKELAKMYENAINELKALKESVNPPLVSYSQSVTRRSTRQKQAIVFPRNEKIKKITAGGSQKVVSWLRILYRNSRQPLRQEK